MVKTCKRCGKELVGRQTSYCSPRCSKLHLQKLYKQRNREKIKLYRRKYRSQGMRPLNGKRKKLIVISRGGECERCSSKENLNVHHVKPLARGGTHKVLLVLCFSCHMAWEKRMKGYWL